MNTSPLPAPAILRGYEMTQTITDKWKSFQDEITRLRAEIDAKSSEIVELQTELHRLRPIADQVDDLRAELAKSEDWIRVLNKTHETNNRLSNERHAETIARLQAKLDGHLQDYKAVHEIGELRDLRAELAALRALVDQKEFEIRNVQHNRREAEAECTRLRAELANATAKLDGHLQDYKAVHEIGELRDLRAELDEIECRYEAHIDGIMRHNWKEVARLREALDELLVHGGCDPRTRCSTCERARSATTVNADAYAIAIYGQ